ncbi:MAG: formate--tetrahydrofolate ligase [Gammaproteobacteria bacterium]|nr:formate--tetrahydrofolate ligase [Gammaproteobacteria bacterium]MYF39117.1 formate--tetrahydrofolate ligase [Gammaproteobacteria bacterium]
MQTNDQSIAQSIELRPLAEILKDKLHLTEDEFTTFGKYKAKILSSELGKRQSDDQAKLVLVTGVSPTAAGEGKTTTSVGLTDALNLLGVNSVACLREPSLGPCFGMKGGAHGGGRAQIAPAIEINLHFNGDLHAITSANNLLSAILENHVYWGNSLDIDPTKLMFLRAMDMNDRSLRKFKVQSRRDLSLDAGFNITAASEVMAVFSLAEDLADLQRRLGNIVVARSRSGEFVTARDLNVDGAMAVLLREALEPNVVQTLEHNPVIVHGGPFANIAHGCNSVIATRTGLALADVVITEAGFGADLGAEKFLNIKCRQTGLKPHAVVIVATIRSIKMHANTPLDELTRPDVEALKTGIVNLEAHVQNLLKMGIVPIVAINRFESDRDDELLFVTKRMRELGVECNECTHWADGGQGAIELAESVMACIAREDCKNFAPLYPANIPLKDKVASVATNIYHARGIESTETAASELSDLQERGFGELPICIAKTQYSFTADPKRLGAPEDHVLPIREVRLSAGAEFVVVVCGNMMTMPGLPRVPAADQVGIDENGHIVGI